LSQTAASRTEPTLESYSAILAYDAPFLRKKMLRSKAFNTSDEFDVAFREFKRFAYLCSQTSAPVGMFSETVDLVWHQFILFTKEYEAFCSSLLGFFLHHAPDLSETGAPLERFSDFQTLYESHFGELDALWLTTAECQNCHRHCQNCHRNCSRQE
jgi:hypothetical protein